VAGDGGAGLDRLLAELERLRPASRSDAVDADMIRRALD
jgi:hypothetical protein